MNQRVMAIAVLAIIVVLTPILYFSANGDISSQIFFFAQANFALIWLLVAIFICILSILTALFVPEGHSFYVIPVTIFLVGVVTLAFYFGGFAWYLFVPNPPIPDALQPGNIVGGIFGLIIIYLTGLGFSLLLTQSPGYSIILAFGMGSGVLSFEMLILGFFKALSLPFALAISLGVLITVWSILAWIRRREKLTFFGTNLHLRLSLNPMTALIISLIGIFFIIILYQAIGYPPTEWDSLVYGVNYAKIIYQFEGIPLIYGPSIGLQISANYPPGTQLVAAFLYALSGGAYDIYYRVLIPMFALGLLAVTYLSSKISFQNKIYRVFAVLGLAAFPIFWLFGVLPSYLMFTALGFAMALFGLVQWSITNRTRFLILAGIACGFAALTSYIGFLFFFLPLVIFGLERDKRHALALFVITGLSGAYSFVWLLRNYILLGNPFYPIGGFGKGLTPLLYHSAADQIKNNFQIHSLTDFVSYFLVPSAISAGPLLPIIGVCLFAALAVILSVKLKIARQHLVILWSMICSFSIFILIVAVNGFYSRYVLILLPAFALGVGLLAYFCNITNSKVSMKALMVIIIGSFVISGLSAMNSGAIPNQQISSTNDYLAQVYGYDAVAWNWLNNHTPANAVIGSYEIRTYYINRTVIPLDGYQLQGIYSGNLSAEDVVSLIQQQNISYIFSVGWASAKASNAPEAYWDNPLIKYLGDPRYFPTLYANPDAAVYGVGGGNLSATADIKSYQMIYLNSTQSFTATITNETTPPSSMVYIAIPPDFQGDLLSISESSNLNASLELWSGLIPENMTTGWWNTFVDTARSPPIAENIPKGLLDPAISTVAQAGYFTLAVVDWSNYSGPEQIAVDISIMPKYQMDQTTISSNGTYNFTSSTTNNSPYSVLYFTPDQSGLIHIDMPMGAAYSDFEIFNTSVPFNGYQGWAANYQNNIVTSTNDLSSYPDSLSFLASQGATYSLVAFNNSFENTDFSKLNMTISYLYHGNASSLTVQEVGQWNSEFANGNAFLVSYRNQTSFSGFGVANRTGQLENFTLDVGYLDKGSGNITIYLVDNGSWIPVGYISLTNSDLLFFESININSSEIGISNNTQYFILDTNDKLFYVLYISAG